MRGAHLLFGLLFVFAGCLNFNDPAPVLWVGFYFAAGAACLLAAAARPYARGLAMVIGVVAFAWGLSYLPAVLRHGQFLAMFDEWTMKNQEIVENREMFGLLIVALWMAVIALTGRRRQPD